MMDDGTKSEIRSSIDTFNVAKLGERLVEVVQERAGEPIEPITDEYVMATSRLPLKRWLKVKTAVCKPSPRSDDVEILVTLDHRGDETLPLFGTCLECDHLDGYGLPAGDSGG